MNNEDNKLESLSYVSEIYLGDILTPGAVVQSAMQAAKDVSAELGCDVIWHPVQKNGLRGFAFGSHDSFAVTRLSLALCGEQVGRGNHRHNYVFSKEKPTSYRQNWSRAAHEMLAREKITCQSQETQEGVAFCFDRRSAAYYFQVMCERGDMDEVVESGVRKVRDPSLSYKAVLAKLTQR